MRAPGFGVGALQENCGVYGLDDALAYWTNARCAGQAYVQHRYCTVYALENKDMIFNKLEEGTVPPRPHLARTSPAPHSRPTCNLLSPRVPRLLSFPLRPSHRCSSSSGQCTSPPPAAPALAA